MLDLKGNSNWLLEIGNFFLKGHETILVPVINIAAKIVLKKEKLIDLFKRHVISLASSHRADRTKMIYQLGHLPFRKLWFVS